MIGIKDMKMPKSCDVCDFGIWQENWCTDGHNYCEFPRMGEIVDDYIACRHPNCPLIEINEKESE